MVLQLHGPTGIPAFAGTGELDPFSYGRRIQCATWMSATRTLSGASGGGA